MAEVYLKDWDANLKQDTYKVHEASTKSFQEREALGGTEVLGKATSFWDEGRKVQVYANPANTQNAYFELLKGGGVRLVQGQLQEPEVMPQSTLFTQGYTGTNEEGNKQTIASVKQESLGITPAEGKEIARTGQTVFNPKTGVEEEADEGEILIEYTDGTVERRKLGSIQTPGQTTAIGEFGRTAEQLGITRQTEIKAQDGSISRAPQSAKQVLDSMIAGGASAEDIDKFLQSEGQTSTADFELIGKTYQGRTASEGNVFYQDPTTRKIIERPEALQTLAKPSTSPTIASERADIPTLFRAVFGRAPNAEELKSWQGRTDKTGGALVGAMQFAKQQGQSVSGQPGGSVDPVQNMKSQANKGQEDLARSLTESGITGRSSDDRSLSAMIDAEMAKRSSDKSVTEFTQDQLAQTQFQEAINDLNQAKDALRQMDTDYTSQLVEAERTPGLSMGAIRRNQGELDIAYQRARRDLVTEVQALGDIVSSQTAIMGMMIDAFKFDQQTAQTEYQNAFNRATTMYNMVRQEQMDEFNIQQKLRENMQANLSVVMGMVQEGTLNYDNLTSEQKSQIQYMEGVVGLTGVTQAIANTDIPPVVSMGSNITGADGTVYTPIISQDPRTGEVSISHYKHPVKERVPSSGGGATALQKDLALAKQFGIDPVNVLEKEFGLPLTTTTQKPMVGPLLPGQTRPNITTRVPQQDVDPSNFRSLGGGLYNVVTGQYIPAPDDEPLY